MRRRGVHVFVVMTLAFFVGCEQEGAVQERTVKDSEGGPFVKSASRDVPSESGEQSAGKDQTKKPGIVFDQTSFDFGEVDAGEKVEHIFKFKNVGDALLKIVKVRSS